MCYGSNHDLVNRYGIYVTNDHVYVCRNHNLFPSSFMAYHRVCDKNNLSAHSGAGTVFSGAHDTQFLFVYVVFCILLLTLFAIVLSCSSSMYS